MLFIFHTNGNPNGISIKNEEALLMRPNNKNYLNKIILHFASVYFSEFQFIQEDLICPSEGSFWNSISIPLRLKDTGACITVFFFIIISVYLLYHYIMLLI